MRGSPAGSRKTSVSGSGDGAVLGQAVAVDTQIHVATGRLTVAGVDPTIPTKRAGRPAAGGRAHRLAPAASYVSAAILDVRGAR
jgi:hypothetical protein